MNYYSTRVIIIIVIVLLILGVIKIKKWSMSKYFYIRLVISSIFLLLITLFIPFENVFYFIKDIDVASKYVNHWPIIIKEEAQDHAFVLYKNKDFSIDYLHKKNDSWQINSPVITMSTSYKYLHYHINYKKVKSQNILFLAITSDALTEDLQIIDDYNTNFHEKDNEGQKIYYAIVNLDANKEKYCLTINHQRTCFRED